MNRGEVGEEASPAKRASRVGEEPCVYALDMERMAALWQKPELVIRLKFAEANSTVKWILESNNGFVKENWQGVDEGLIDARIMEVEELLELALESRGILRLFRLSYSGSEEESDKEVKNSGDEEDDGQNHNYEKDARADLALILVCKNWGRRRGRRGSESHLLGWIRGEPIHD